MILIFLAETLKRQKEEVTKLKKELKKQNGELYFVCQYIEKQKKARKLK